MDVQVTAALITGLAAVVAAAVGLGAAWLANRRGVPGAKADTHPKVPVAERLTFVDVVVDVSTDDWYEGNRLRVPATRRARWCITRRGYDEGADLPIRATLLNTGDIPIVVSRVGVEVVAAHNSWYTGVHYGVAPKASPIESTGQYELWLSSADDIARGVAAVMDMDPDIDEWLDIGALCSRVLPKPIYVEPAAPLVYTTNLKQYDKGMPTDAILRLWIQTDSGELRSDDILVAFGR